MADDNWWKRTCKRVRRTHGNDKELEEINIEESDSTILIVEDDTEINELIRQFFEIKLPEYKILQAFDGFEAGRFVSEHKPSVLILDITLPGVDGYTLCKNIKSDPNLNSPYIIAITGMSNILPLDFLFNIFILSSLLISSII